MSRFRLRFLRSLQICNCITGEERAWGEKFAAETLPGSRGPPQMYFILPSRFWKFQTFVPSSIGTSENIFSRPFWLGRSAWAGFCINNDWGRRLWASLRPEIWWLLCFAKFQWRDFRPYCPLRPKNIRRKKLAKFHKFENFTRSTWTGTKTFSQDLKKLNILRFR